MPDEPSYIIGMMIIVFLFGFSFGALIAGTSNSSKLKYYRKWAGIWYKEARRLKKEVKRLCKIIDEDGESWKRR